MAKFSVSKFNKTRLFDIDTTGFDYMSLDDLYDGSEPKKVFVIRGIFIGTKGKFGAQPIFALDTCFVNIPQHQLETAEELRATPEAVEAINNGDVGFMVRPYTSKRYNKQCYDIVFVDLD